MPADTDSDNDHPIPPVRDAHDAEHHADLKNDPRHEDAQVDVALDESFPTSDAPGHAPAGSGEPAPSSGFDEETERKIAERRARAYALWEKDGRPEGRHLFHWEQAGVAEPLTNPWVEGP